MGMEARVIATPAVNAWSRHARHTARGCARTDDSLNFTGSGGSLGHDDLSSSKRSAHPVRAHGGARAHTLVCLDCMRVTARSTPMSVPPASNTPPGHRHHRHAPYQGCTRALTEEWRTDCCAHAGSCANLQEGWHTPPPAAVLASNCTRPGARGTLAAAHAPTAYTG